MDGGEGMHLRQNDLDAGESGALRVRERGRSPPGPYLSQIISFGIANPPWPDLEFLQPRPLLCGRQWTSRCGSFMCTHIGVYGGLFSSPSLIYCPSRFLCGRFYQQQDRRRAWALGCVRNERDTVKAKRKQAMKVVRLQFLLWNFKTRQMEVG